MGGSPSEQTGMRRERPQGTSMACSGPTEPSCGLWEGVAALQAPLALCGFSIWWSASLFRPLGCGRE